MDFDLGVWHGVAVSPASLAVVFLASPVGALLYHCLLEWLPNHLLLCLVGGTVVFLEVVIHAMLMQLPTEADEVAFVPAVVALLAIGLCIFSWDGNIHICNIYLSAY